VPTPSLLELRAPTWPTGISNSQFLPTSNHFETPRYDVPFTGRDSNKQPSQHEGSRSNPGPWSLVEATVASSSVLQHARVPATAYTPRFDLGFDHSSVAAAEYCVDPQTTTPTHTSMLESGLSDASGSLFIPEVYPTNIGYPLSSSNEPQEGTGTQRSIYDLLADFLLHAN
jgi:hypothetical protein